MGSIGQTGARANITIANPGRGQRTVRLRYRETPSGAWSETETAETTTASATIDLTGLTSGTQYEVQATLAGDFTAGAQSTTFTTLPPAVTSVTVSSEAQDKATVTVAVSAPNDSDVHLRYRTGTGTWITESKAADVGASSVDFELTALTSGSDYVVQASYDAAFPEEAAKSASFTTLPPSLSGVSVGSITRTEATATVAIAAPNGDSQTVRLRYRATPSEPWSATQTTHTNTASATIDLAGLTSATEYEVQATLGGDFTAGVQSATFITTRSTARSSSPSGGGGGGGGGGPPPVPIPSEVEFEWNVTRDIESLDSEHQTPTGLWSDGQTLWLVENSASGADAVFAYDIETGERQAGLEFELDRRNRFSHGVWSNGEIVWVADSGQDQLFAYDLESGERLEQRDLELHEDNRDPRGIWSDGEAIYVLDSVKDALFVYDLETGELIGQPPPLDKLNKSPRGLWSDGTTLWVSDDGAKRLFAYRIEDAALTRHEDLEFSFRPLLKAGNGDPRGIWSDGDVVFVADEQDDHVYTYNLPDAIDARLASLALSGVEIGQFSPALTDYTGRAASGVTTTTIRAAPMQQGATVAIEPASPDGETSDDRRLTLNGPTEITITVTSADRSRSRVYRVQVSREQCLTGLSDSRLSRVSFSGGSVDELLVCARSLGVGAVFHHHDGDWVAYFLNGPEFINQGFRNRFGDGLPAGETLIAKRESASIAASAAPGEE